MVSMIDVNGFYIGRSQTFYSFKTGKIIILPLCTYSLSRLPKGLPQN